VREQAPWAALESDRERAATILHVALRCIDDLKLMLSPFLPHSSQELHELLGHEGSVSGTLEFREVEEEDGSRHTVLTGDYASAVGRWEPGSLPAGQELAQPRPLFRKLDPAAVVAEELERMTRASAG
jgi:methionyl-tRNA synthetase